MEEPEKISEKLTEPEKQVVEKEILEEINNKIKEDQENKKKTKNQLISDFIKMQELVGKIKYTEQQLKKMTKGEILKKIAEYGSDKIDNPSRFEKIDDLMAVSLYNMNMCIIKLLEGVSSALKQKTGDIAILEDLSSDVEQRREAFIFIFKQIYIENSEVINTYMSPLSQYIMLMTQCIGTAATKNIAKKKEVSED